MKVGDVSHPNETDLIRKVLYLDFTPPDAARAKRLISHLWTPRFQCLFSFSFSSSLTAIISLLPREIPSPHVWKDERYRKLGMCSLVAKYLLSDSGRRRASYSAVHVSELPLMAVIDLLIDPDKQTRVFACRSTGSNLPW